MLLTEDYSKEEIEDIFDDMKCQFADFEDDIPFDIYDVSSILRWLAPHNRKTLGRCTYQGGRYYISLNPNLLKFGNDGYNIIKDVIAHELCHTLPGCLNHGPEFHKYARLIGQLMGYKIDTKADVDASNYFGKYLPDANYRLICNKCGNEIPKSNMCDAVKNPSRYKCSKCGGTLDSYKLNKFSNEYELYKTHEEAPEYKYSIICPDCDWRMNNKTRNASFSKYVNALNHGDSLVCPRCGKHDLYAIDNGKEVHSDEEYLDWLA